MQPIIGWECPHADVCKTTKPSRKKFDIGTYVTRSIFTAKFSRIKISITKEFSVLAFLNAIKCLGPCFNDCKANAWSKYWATD